MRSLVRVVPTFLVLAAGGATASGQESETSVPVPRYRLEAGQELTYAAEMPYKNPDGSVFVERRDWSFWVAGWIGGGGGRILARQGTAYVQKAGPPPAARVLLASFTLSP